MIIGNLTIVKGGEMEDLIKKIEQWANDRNIIKGSRPIDQAMKLFSEFGELADNVGKGRDCRDDVGDCVVVLAIIASQLGETIAEVDIEVINYPYGDKPTVSELCGHLYEFVCHAKNDVFDFNALSYCLEFLQCIAINQGHTLQECIQIAYDDISKRQGILWNGVFVKNTDENFNEIKSLFEKSIENNLSI